MIEEDLEGFASVISSPYRGEGMIALLQGAGLSSLSPNTMLCAWPENWKTDKLYGSRLVNLLKWVRAHKKSAVFVKGVDYLPTSKEPQYGTIDIWWIVHEGGFLMLLAVLLKKNKIWKKCTLRIFTVAELTENSLSIENQIKKYLYYLRIKAEVKIVEMSTHQFAYFTNEWTVLRGGRFGNDSSGNKEHFFPSFIDDLHGIRHLSREERVASLQINDLALPEMSRDFSLTVGSTMTLQKAIVEHSQFSSLIIMNMPVPSQLHLYNPDEYMEMIDFLTQPLQRVFLVSGCGQEVIQVN
jgi:potassium/chloride transporter 4/5/6